MFTETREALADRLCRFGTEGTPAASTAEADRAVEVGVGHRPAVARALAERGLDVTATDVHDRPTPEGVRFVRDDVTDSTLAHYRDADIVYALNCPPELQAPLVDVARRADAACAFTTLGTDPATVPARAETVASETLFRAAGAAGALDSPGSVPSRGERP